jgi:hypothetical protein
MSYDLPGRRHGMPTIDERARHDLFEAVQGSLGQRHADTLMSLLPPVGWADVATKQDLSQAIQALTERMDHRFGAVDHGFEAVDHRFEGLDHRFEALDHRFEAINHRFTSVDQRFDALEQKMDERFEKLEYKLLSYLHKSQSEQTRVLIFGLVGSLAVMASTCLGSVALMT